MFLIGCISHINLGFTNLYIEFQFEYNNTVSNSSSRMDIYSFKYTIKKAPSHQHVILLLHQKITHQ